MKSNYPCHLWQGCGKDWRGGKVLDEYKENICQEYFEGSCDEYPRRNGQADEIRCGDIN